MCEANASLPVLLDDGTHKYVWGLGLAFAVNQAGNPLVYHADGLGSVRALTDAIGSVVQTYQYDEYGNVVSSQGSVTQPFGYMRGQRDDQGLKFRVRLANPAALMYSVRGRRIPAGGDSDRLSRRSG